MTWCLRVCVASRAGAAARVCGGSARPEAQGSLGHLGSRRVNRAAGGARLRARSSLRFLQLRCWPLDLPPSLMSGQPGAEAEAPQEAGAPAPGADAPPGAADQGAARAGPAAAGALVPVVTKGRSALDSDLAFILDDREVDSDLQDRLASTGITKLSLFVLLADSRADFRNLLAEQFGLDPAAQGILPAESLRRRMEAARILDAWEAGRARVDIVNKRDAERRSEQLPKSLLRSEHIELRRAYEGRFGRVADKVWPSEAYIERRFEQVEEGDLVAEALSEAVPKDLALDGALGADFTREGTIRVRRGANTIPLPRNSEELRLRVKTVGVTFYLAMMRHGNRPYLSDCAPGIWLEHLDYILGEDVMQLEARGADDKPLHRPDWNLVLSYEHQVRKRMTRLGAYENCSIGKGLLLARQDMEIKSRFFTTPLSFAAVAAQQDNRRGSSSADKGRSDSSRPGPYSGRAARKKGGKGRPGKQGPSKDWHSETPDGRKICFAWNNRDEKCRGGCGFVHVCRRCFGDHPAHACKSAPAKGQGDGKAPGQ